MSEYTKYLRLIKPQGNEYYNVENFNHNAELIDKETEKLNNAVTKIQEGATTEKAGIVQFGTEEGKALEGMMLARLAGCVGYGGDIQTAGVKDINYIYYDRNTRKMYKCLNQNSDVSANVANFIPLDNNSLLDRLENLDRNLLYKIDRWSPKDEDELIKTGIFQIKGATSKLKRGFCGSQCFVLVFNTSVNGDDYVTQIAFSYYDTFSIAIRTRNGDTKQWTPWRYLSAN
nr:MAG TPA: hypothetical protein [Caudoviricetes sp.]